MAHQPIATRVLWDGKTCVARHENVEVVVRFRPPVLGNHIEEIDYAPTCRSQRLRESAQAWRDMTPAEAVALHAWLVRLVDDTRASAVRAPKE